MNKKLQLILHEVSRQFRSERAFYHSTIGITQRAWEKYKSGETDFNNIKLSNYQAITGVLFTRYETMLLQQAIDATKYNWYDDVVEAFHDIKLIHAKAMLKRGASIEIATSHFEDSQPTRNSITRIKIVDEIDMRNKNTVTFQIDIPPHQVPSGKRNRLEWFKNEFEKVVII